MIPSLVVTIISRAERPHRHHNTAYHRHIHLSTMFIYTAVVGAVSKTATLLTSAHLLDRVLTRLSVMLPLGAGIA